MREEKEECYSEAKRALQERDNTAHLPGEVYRIKALLEILYHREDAQQKALLYQEAAKEVIQTENWLINHNVSNYWFKTDVFLEQLLNEISV